MYMYIYILSASGVKKLLYDLLSSNGIVNGWETDKLDSLMKILMLTLSQNIGIALVVVMHVDVGAEWFSKEVFNVLLSLDCAVTSSLDLDLGGESEVTIS